MPAHSTGCHSVGERGKRGAGEKEQGQPGGYQRKTGGPEVEPGRGGKRGCREGGLGSN